MWALEVTNDDRNITRSSLGKMESAFIAQVATMPSFSLEDARAFLGKRTSAGGERKLVEKLRKKGWIERIKAGRFAVIPLSSGSTRSTQLHEFHIAMELLTPAAIAYFSAMNHHGLTEQLPRTVFVATDHRVSRSHRDSLGIHFKIISLREKKFFGFQKEWVGERPFMITDPEKTIIDSLDLPVNAGGIGTVAAALRNHWENLNHSRLFSYARRIGNSTVAKRLGFLMETLELGDAESFRASVKLGSGYPRLDPTLARQGKHNRRWGLLINVQV